MTIGYSLSREEIAAWYWYSLRHYRPMRLAWARRVLIAAAVGVALTIAGGSASLLTVALSGAGAALAVALVSVVYPQLAYKLQERSLTIGSAGITTSIGKYVNKTVPWSAAASVEEVGQFLCIRGTNLNAFVIPQRAFGSGREKDEFATRCAAFHASGSAVPAV